MSDWRPRMRKAVRHLSEQLAGIRPGSLSVGFLETFRVTLHGNTVNLNRMSAITQQGDRIIITPFDPTNVSPIVKSLAEAKLNAYALNPKTVCVAIPPISGEQRAEMIKHVKKLGEEAKIAVRAVRQDARKEISAKGRGSERAVQEATDEAVAEIDRFVKTKIAELSK